MINNYIFHPKGGPLAIASPNYKQLREGDLTRQAEESAHLELKK